MCNYYFFIRYNQRYKDNILTSKFSILENFLRVKKCQFSNTQTITKQNRKLCQILRLTKFSKKFT